MQTADLFEFADLTVKQQSHLTKVYGILGSGMLTVLLTFLTTQYLYIPWFIFMVLGVASAIADIAIFCSRKQRKGLNVLNLLSFYGYALSVGGVLGTKIITLDYASKMFYYSICLEAFVSTLLLFVVVSVFSILTAKRAAIYFGSLALITIISIARIFIWNKARYIMLGVVVECLYFIVDTQNILKNSQSSEPDPVMDAKVLLIDCVKIFYKILAYLEKYKKEDEKKKKDK